MKNEVELPVQVLGKVRGTIVVSKTATQDEVVKKAKENPDVAKFLTGDIKKIIYIPERILNFVI